MGNGKDIIRDYSLIGRETRRAIDTGLAEAEWYKSPVPRAKMRELLTRKNDPAIRDTIIWFTLIFGSGYLVFHWWSSWFVREIEYYLCGPPAMIHAALKMLKTLGVQDDMIAFDEF